MRTRAPLAIGDDSEPEPDVTVIPEDDYSGHHPTRAALVIEVLRSGEVIDLGVKAAIYAAGDVTGYWVVDAVARQLHAHSRPAPRGCQQVTVHENGVVATSGEPVLTLDLDALFSRPGSAVS